jgi:hypothetical protein
VRAVGSFEQEPGCPDDATAALSPERLARLCKGECYNPGDARRPITRLEVVRIRPRATPGEDVGPLIEDPWRVHVCPGDPAGCEWTFEDADFAAVARDVAYYVRAVEAPSPAINAANLRCTYDDQGECIAVDRCGTAETVGDDCLAEAEERAWSSPIFVDWSGARTAAGRAGGPLRSRSDAARERSSPRG